MMASSMCLFNLQLSRCRIKSLPNFGSAYVACVTHNFHTLRHSSGRGSELLYGSNVCKTLLRTTILSRILQPISTRTGQRAKDTKNTESRDTKHLVRVFVIDIETTGFSKERSRIVEFAIRDLSGGKGSRFQTLVNPEQHVPNSHIHGITTDMVNRPDVPRMKDLIPILVQYIKGRLTPGELALFVAHSGRTFDVPFLRKEFSRCSMNIPSDWRFLDTLPLGREFMKANGLPSHKASLQALRECLDIPTADSSDSHRAMSDVNLLSSILGRLTFEMKLTVSDLMERSFKASDPIKSKKIKTKI